jgi:nitrate reductase beta subunit
MVHEEKPVAVCDRATGPPHVIFGATPEISHSFRVEGDHVMGYDAKGAEVVRVPIREPIVIREVYDIKHKAYRTNIT